MEYVVNGIRRRDLISDNTFWDLIREYHGFGEFVPFEEGGDEGNFEVFISSGSRLSLDELRKKFPSLEILDLEEKVQ